MKEFYLGDGVYISIEHGEFRLVAGDNIIYLDSDVTKAFIDYVNKLQGKR